MAFLELLPATTWAWGIRTDLSLHGNDGGKSVAEADIIAQLFLDEFDVAVSPMTVRRPRPRSCHVVNELSVEEDRQFVKEFSKSLGGSPVPIDYGVRPCREIWVQSRLRVVGSG